MMEGLQIYKFTNLQIPNESPNHKLKPKLTGRTTFRANNNPEKHVMECITIEDEVAKKIGEKLILDDAGMEKMQKRQKKAGRSPNIQWEGVLGYKKFKNFRGLPIHSQSSGTWYGL